MNSDAITRRLKRVTLGEINRGPVVLADPDPQWPVRYRRHATAVAGALGATVLRLEHVGSTAVPDLPAKPVIDILLVVPDPADESAYVAALGRIGYHLRIREPDWHEHRLLSPPDRDANVHVFGPHADEVEQMLCLRDRLRTHAADRERYAREKRALAGRSWPTVQHYAEAKTGVITDILARARAADDHRPDAAADASSVLGIPTARDPRPQAAEQQ